MSRLLGCGRIPIVVVVVSAVFVGLLYVVGLTHPPARPAVGTDRLGPENGQLVEEYLSQSSASLAGARAGARWALVSLRAGLDDEAAWAVTSGTMRSQVAFHVAVPQVATPTLLVPVTDIRRSLDLARGQAVSDAQADAVSANPSTAGDRPAPAPDPDTARSAAIARLVVRRLSGDCACVVALVVRGLPSTLRQLAARPQVRAVEVLPADAAGGRFAVVPLLPETTGRVGPSVDTGPVPPA
ncbi:hypothetical protein [Williamsia sp. CHRR-6]|uniref:hypothetical protein n=1 Tax=Williamsia sp. CHRR-6 TaxID=2835871 RepID=UPI001BDA7600|nr:hypothetical protein [Williamsia sp. CHRR-6]MBT0565244.1 hypothetical protein [Williamsia sp. CHRR-6]